MSNKNKLIPLVTIVLGVTLIMIAGFWLLRPNSPQPTAIPTEVAAPTTAAVSAPAVITRVSLDDAKSAFDAGTAVFLDVRTVASYQQSHIEGALLIPEEEIATRLSELDPSDWIITYCT